MAYSATYKFAKFVDFLASYCYNFDIVATKTKGDKMEKKKFGQFIKVSRIKKGFTQKELADRLFIDETAVSKWERGVSYPDITLISGICKNLDISEKELIESTNDSEYHKIEKDAKNYNRIKNMIFYGFSIGYLIALFVCFIVNLAVDAKLSWFFLVLSSCLVGFTFVPTCLRFFKKHKLYAFIGSTFLALFLLYLTCSIYTHNYWFMTATLGTLIGYVVIFYPIVFYKTKLGLSEQKFERFKKWFLLTYAFGMAIVTVALLIIINFYRPFNLFNGIVITLYSYTILAVFGLIGLIKTNAFTKIGLGFLSVLPYLFGLEMILDKLLGGNDGGSYYDVDFSHWSTHINANVTFIVKLSLLGLGILFLTLGLLLHYKLKKQK